MRKLSSHAAVVLTIILTVCPWTWAGTLFWDADGAAPIGGAGTWDTTNARWTDGITYQAWINANNDDAVFDVAGGAVTVGAAVNVQSMTWNVNGYSTAGTNAITLAGSPVFTVANAGDAVTLGAPLAGVGFKAAGPGTISLTAATNTFAGNVVVNGGAVNFTADSQLGNAANDITLDGGRINYNSTTADWDPANTRVITIGASGGTIGGSRKITLNDAGQLAGAGTLTKADGAILMVTGNNSGIFTGNAIVNAGTLEISGSGLGSGAGQTITVNGGEMAAANSTLSHAVIMNGGTLSGDNGNSTYTGAISANAPFAIGLRDFHTAATGRSLTLSGPLSGSGAIAVSAPNGQTLTLNGNNSGYSGTMTLNANVTGVFNSGSVGANTGVVLAGGAARIYGVGPAGPAGVNGLNATYYNIAASINAVDAANFAIDSLYLHPRTISRIDTAFGSAGVPGAFNMPTTDYPPIPLPNFQVPDNLAMMWKGQINIATGGTYSFRVSHDDGMALYIDGVPVFERNSTGSNITASVTLGAGAHSFVTKFQQGGGGKYFVLEYAGADTGGAASYQIVGSTAGTVTTGSPAPMPMGAAGGNGTLSIFTDINASSFTLGAGNTFTLNSNTVSTLAVSGATTLTGAGTLAPNTGTLAFNGAIGQSAPGTGLTLAGPGQVIFRGVNTFNGTTTITGGQLVLDAAGGESIAGNLDLNAANANGPVANLKLLRSNQIADTASVTVRNYSVMDIDGFSDTVGTLNVSPGGMILGSGGTIGASTFNLTGGQILAGLGGSGSLTVAAGNTVVLGGVGSYSGATTVAGILQIRNNALGDLTGATTVNAGGQLQTLANFTSGEAITITGTGPAIGDGGAIRHLHGSARLTAPITLAGNATIQSDNGQLILAANPVAGGNTLTFQGKGALTFDYDTAGVIPVTHASGIIGFNGTQSGAFAVPAAADKAYRFNSDPTAAATLTAPAGSTVIAGFDPTQAFLTRFAAGSAGTLALTANSAAALDMAAAGQNLSLGSAALVRYSGALTPNGSTYRLGGGGGAIVVERPLTGTNNLVVSGPGVVGNSADSTFSGSITINDGATLQVVNNTQLGAASNGVTLTNGGTLELIQNARNTGGLFAHLGHPTSGGIRQISVGTGGGTLSLPSYDNLNSLYVLAGNGTVSPLTGSGALAKTGYGNLMLTTTTNYSGDLTVAAQGGAVEMRGTGALPNVNSVTVNQDGYFIVDNWNGWGRYGSAHNANRVNDAAPIALKGGLLYYRSRNAAGQAAETFGATTIGEGFSLVRHEVSGQGSDVTMANLLRADHGTVRFENSTGAFGSTGNNARQFFTLINGLAPTSTNVVNGWAFISNNGGNFQFAAYDTTAGVGLKPSTMTAQINAAFTPVAANAYDLTTTGTATLSTPTAGVADNLEVAAIRFTAGGAQTLAFADALDTLHVSSGGIMDNNQNQARTIGASALRGKLTAGPVGATTPQDLFFHFNQNTVTVESVIVDNPGANGVAGGGDDQPVSLVKDLNGVLQLNTANTYSGGTYLYAGRINVVTAGGLGSGPVVVKGSTLELRAAGATTNTTGIVGKDASEIYLQNQGIAYTQPGDRFIIEAGSSITGESDAAGISLASLTRVSSLTGGGQIILQPGAIVRTTNAVNGDVSLNLPANLGANADLYFNMSGGGGQNQYITVGAGTPWKGLSTSVGGGWNQGTIYANSDFWIQGLNRLRSNVIYTLGGTGVGSYAVVNNANAPINAYVTGQVQMNEDTLVRMSNDVTIVATKDSYLVPSYANSFGNREVFGTRAKLLAQSGSVVDPGNYTAINPYGLTDSMYGKQYPLPSPMNTDAVFEAGSRLLINDASGIGSTTGGATWAMKADSILHLGTANAFFGGYDPANPGVNATGLINAGQFVYEPGAIIRYETGRLFRHNQFINNEPNGTRTVLEIHNGNRDITDAVNPFLVPATGVVRVEPMTLRFADGGMITNDSADRNINERRGKLLLENGAILAGTNQQWLNIQENIEVPAGHTIYIGSDRYVDGLPKLGSVQLYGTASNVINGNVVIRNGAQLTLGGMHTWTDTAGIDLPHAVNFASLPYNALANQPGTGTSLLLNAQNYLEIIGPLTGVGAVLGNQSATHVGVGWGATADFTFEGVFDGNTGNHPSLFKVGPSRMTLTNYSDTAGALVAWQGEVVLSGPNGKWGAPTNAATDMRLARGGTLIFDNTGTAVADRQVLTGGGADWLTTTGGGELKLLGHATQVADVTMYGIADSAGTWHNGQGGNSGGAGIVTVIPSGDLSTLRTSLTFQNAERFDNAGERNSVWLIRGVGLGGLPGTWDAAGNYTANPGNPKDGLVFITNPNMLGALTYGFNGQLPGAAGTPVAPVLPHILASGNASATSGDFATIDIPSGATRTGVRALQPSEYAARSFADANLSLNVRVGAGQTLAFSGGDSRFSVLKMEDGSTLSVSGTLPSLAQRAQVMLNAGGILVPDGATASITSAAGEPVRMGSGVSAYLHAYGDLNISAPLYTDIRVVKAGSGTVTFAPGAAKDFRGGLVVHDGVLNLNDSLSNVRNNAIGEWSFYGPVVELNGGTLNLNGYSQNFTRLESGSYLAGTATEGGTLTSATPARVTFGRMPYFSGHITGAITLDKVDTSVAALTNTNTYTGATILREGTLILRDSATLANTSQVDINYARLEIDDGYLAYVTDRINPAAAINMRGANFALRGRAGTLTQQHFGTVNLLAGMNRFETYAGGGGATETIIGDLVRSTGAVATFNQNYGFVGTPGNDTTSIRYLPTLINGQPIANVVAANNGILGGWAIVNGNDFATWLPGQGLGAMGNTEDGFRAYDSGDLSTAAPTHNVNDGTARTIATSKTVNSLRFNGGVTHTIAAGQTLTINTGGILSNTNNTGLNGGSITSNTNDLVLFVNSNTLTIGSAITGNISLTKTGNGNVSLTGANTYTGATYVGVGGSTVDDDRAGDLQLNLTGANGTTAVAIPGNLHIYNSQVQELQPNQIKETADVYLYGGSRLYMRDAGALTETLNSIHFRNVGGPEHNHPAVLRVNTRADSVLRLTGATAISSDNDSPVITPGFHGQLGQIQFAGAAGTEQVIRADGPVTRNGLSSVGFFIDPAITLVPTGVDDGGLVKRGQGMVILRANNTFGSPATATEVFNVAEGFVRLDGGSTVLGTPNCITTVQNGAVLLLNGTTNTGGSLQLLNGSTLGMTIANGTLGAVGTAATLTVPAGQTTSIQVRDYFVENTNAGNITVNNKLTGAGTINLVGTEFASGYNGGGVLVLQNTANDFSGTFNVGPNAVLQSNSSTGNTGNTFGSATINLAGGVLRVRDQGDNTGTANTLTYNNAVVLTADSYVNHDRLGNAAANKTILMPTLTVPSGAQGLYVNNGNSFRTAFGTLAGPGTLVVTGNGALDINAASTAVGAVPSIEIAGPKGMNLLMAGNLSLNAATTALNNFTIGGYHTVPSGKTVTANTLTLSPNTGVGNGLNGLDTGALGGSLLIHNAATVTAGTFRNYGVVASTNAAATLNATTLAGTGGYNSYGLSLTVRGTLDDDGAAATALKVYGNNTVTFVPTGSGLNTGGADVQSGTLRVAPTAGVIDPLGSGGVRIVGAPASTPGAYSQSIAALSATLHLDTAGNAIAQSGTITNSGLLRVSGAGAVTLGAVQGVAPSSLNNLADFLAATTPGLLEGFVSDGGLNTTAARPANPGQFGVVSEPRMGQTNFVTNNPITGWSGNALWIYTGYFYDADGVFAFAENIDDRTMVSIDGVMRLYNDGDRITSTASKTGLRGTGVTANANTATVTDLITAAQPLAANPNLPAGWHTIEIRFNNGSGGAGPWGVTNGFTNNYGFGFNPDGTTALDGSAFFRPIDNGGNLFRTASYGKGNIQLDAGTNVTAQAIAQINQLGLAAGGTSLRLTGTAAPSTVDSINVTGAGTTSLTLESAVVLNTGTLAIQAGQTLTVNGPGTLGASGNVGAAGSTINLNNATLDFNTTGTQTNTAAITGAGTVRKSNTGTLILQSDNTYAGTTEITGGTLKLPDAATAMPNVAGLLYRLDASDTSRIIKDGSNNVSGWNDSSINGRNFLQGTLASQPLYVANAVNGLAAIRFDGGSDQLILSTSTTPASILIVQSAGINTGGDRGIWGPWNADAGLRQGTYGWWGDKNTGDFITNGTSGTVYVNGVTAATLPVTTGQAVLVEAIKTSGVGAFGNTGLGFYTTAGGGGRYYHGDICEVLAYDTALSAADRVALEQYLISKWLLPTNIIPDSSPVVMSGTGTFDLNDRSETVGSLAGTGTVLLGSGVLTTGGTGASTTFAGSIQGAGSLVKTGSGAFTLAGTNTFAGPLDLQQGAVIVDGSIIGQIQMSLSTSTQVGGEGWIDSVLNVQPLGKLSAGPLAGAGHLLVDTLNLNGDLVVELAGLAAGTGYDQIEVEGVATLSGLIDVNWFNGFIGHGPFDIVVAHGGIVPSNPLSLTFNFDDALYGEHQWVPTILTLTDGTQILRLELVPEPITVSLMCVGLAGLGGYIRRRRRVA